MDKLQKLFDELNKDDTISKCLMVLVNTIESTKRLGIRSIVKKANAIPSIRAAFEKNTDGLVIHFKINKEFAKVKSLDLKSMELLDKVKKAVNKTYPKKFENFEAFSAKIGTTEYFNVVCF